MKLLRKRIKQKLHDVRRYIVHKSNRSRLQREFELVARLSNSLDEHAVSGSPVAGVVFSMDRALQLHALLGSYKDKVKNPVRLTVIYRATSDRHRQSYQEVFEEYGDIIEAAVEQSDRSDFKTILVDVLENRDSERVVFFVDDLIFIEPVDMAAFARLGNPYVVPSLRLGENIRYANTGTLPASKPLFSGFPVDRETTATDGELLCWRWGLGGLDWGYPLSVDGHVFQRAEILAFSRAIDFDSPNRFEANLQKFGFLCQCRVGVCFRKSRIVNIPYNRVQSDYENMHGDVHQDEMLEMFEQGYRINRNAYYGITNSCVHEELPLKVERVVQAKSQRQ